MLGAVTVNDETERRRSLRVAPRATEGPITNLNDPNSQREFPQEAEGSSFGGATWISLGFIAVLFAGVAFWAYQSGDMREAANTRPGVERKMPTATTGQSAPSNPGAPSSAPATKDSAK